jgi:hypothetical protein
VSAKLLLVDFENVQELDLSGLDENFQIMVFVGASQKSVPIELVKNLQGFGNRVDWQKVDGNGSNALDFFIACQLGRVWERSPQLQCIVLSKDKGFDPLLLHLRRNGLKCRRIESLHQLGPKAASAEESGYARVVEILGKSERKARPRKRETLAAHIASIFQKKIDQPGVDRIIGMLLTHKMISESNNAIVYNF